MLRAALAILVLMHPAGARAQAAQDAWIEPLRWRIAPGETLRAEIMAGPDMTGAPMRLTPGSQARLEVLTPEGPRKPGGPEGGATGFSLATGAAGLYEVLRVSKDDVVTYDDFDAFRAFVTDRGLGDVLERHAERGLGRTRVSELRTRFDKALVAVGDGAGRDRVLGLTAELTALTNPYGAPAQSLAVLATWQKIPRPDARVEVVERAPAGAVRSFAVDTDADGMALVPVNPGHAYLLRSVVMLAHLPEAPGAPAWHSYRASLSFAVPAHEE